MVFSFFQIPWTTYGRSSLEPKDHNQSALDEFSIHIVNLPVLLLLRGLSGRNMLNLFDILIHASTTQKNYIFLELSPFSCIPTLAYQLMVKSMCALVFIGAFYSCGPSSHSIPKWQVETNSNTLSISRIVSKQCYSANQNVTPSFVMFYLGVLPSLCQESHVNCTTSYEVLM